VFSTLYTLYCIENCLQLLQILIVSLLMLHIDIVGVFTCSDNSSRRLVMCIIGSFFSIHFIITLHCSIAYRPYASSLCVSWPAPLQLRYATWGAIHVLYAFAFVSISITILQKKLKFNEMLSILVDDAAANEQLTVNITSNFPQYC